ncbi:MAG: hypothetical protein ABIN57_01395 [Chitinophagaceae bacterium]
MKKIIAGGLLLLLFISARAQTDSAEKRGPQFKISANYNSNLNYYGRTDSLKSSGVFPMAELWFSPEFYINAAPIFINNAAQSFAYAGTVTTIGYQHITDHWLTSISLVKPFYQQNSQLVQSALKAQASTSFSYLNKFLNLSVGGDVKFSDKVDYGASAGVDHIIRLPIGANSVVVLDPSFYTYAGTQQFSKTYTKKKKGNLLFPGTEQQVSERVQQFNILAYEVSLPVIVAKGKIQVVATPSYVIPQNLLVVPGRPDLTEKGENTFYTTLGLKFTF